LLDIFTLFLFLAMFSVWVLSRRRIEEEKMVLPRQIKSLLCRIEEKGSLVYGLTLIGFWWNIFAFALPLAIFFILFPHLDIFWVLITAIVLSSIYGAAIFVVALKKLGSRVNSSVMPFQIVLQRMIVRSTAILVILLVILLLNWISFYAHDIDSWMKGVTEL
jgi:hypothetical protein